MIELRKFIIFLFVALLLFHMSRLLYFTKRKWRVNSYTFATLLSGILLVFIATFLDMSSNLIHSPLVFTVIKILFTIGPITFVIGIILWSNFTINMITNLESTILKDSFTGVLNRSGIEKVYKSYVKLNNPFYVLVCDLNGTKRINDKYGHIEGDKYILTTTKIITASIGSKGHLARIGGDEFIVILDYILPQELENIIFNIKNQISKINPKENTGISIGYGIYPYNCKQFKDLINFADEKMYYDKQNTKIMSKSLVL